MGRPVQTGAKGTPQTNAQNGMNSPKRIERMVPKRIEASINTTQNMVANKWMHVQSETDANHTDDWIGA